MKRHSCKYCGISKVGQSLRCHEACCPEMKYFADYILEYITIEKPTKLFKKESAIISIETTNEKIIKVIKQYNEGG